MVLYLFSDSDRPVRINIEASVSDKNPYLSTDTLSGIDVQAFYTLNF